MEFRDWFGRGSRRQAAGPPGSAPAETDAGDGTEPEAAPEAVRPARPEADRDWDGGWRRVAPPAVTVARSSIGVSDGLRFRSRLASWQNIAYGGELGHAVLPSAPVGLIHGVTRPGTARPTTAPGTPLLLRAATTGGQEEPVQAPPSGSAGRTPAVQRTPAAGRRPSGTQPRSAAGREPASRQPGSDEATAGAAATAGTGVGPVAGPRPSAARGAGASTSTGQSTSTGSGATTAARPAPVRPRRTAPPLIVARRPVTAPRRLAAFAPPAPPTPATPVGEAATPGRTDTGRAAPGERLPTVAPERAPEAPAAPPVRPALGRPLRQLPPGAAPFVAPGPASGAPSGSTAPQDPALPVVQRQTPETAAPASPATASPATAFPAPPKPSTEVGRQPGQRRQSGQPADRQRPFPGAAPASGPAAPRPGTPGPPPAVQRAPAPSTRRTETPASGDGPASAPRPPASAPRGPGSQARTRGGLGAPLSSLPPTAGTAGTANDAPLLGDPRRARPGTTGPLPGGPPAGERRASTPSSPPPSAMPLRAPAHPGAGPASPSAQPAAVQRAADPTRTSTTTVTPPSSTTTVTPPSSTAPATPPAPVRVRRITSRGPQGQAPGPVGESGKVAVQRSRALLAGRTLTVRTGAAEGFTAPVSATTTRPVVAATWRRDARPQVSDGQPPAGGGARPESRQAAPAHPATVQRSVPGSSPSGAPSTGVRAQVAGSPARRAAPQGDVPGEGAKAGNTGGPAARSLTRLVQRSARGATPSGPPLPGRERPGQPGARTPELPSPAQQSVMPAPSAPSATRTPATPAPPVPVVRPHPPGSARPGGVAVPVQRLQMPVAPETGAPATGPAPATDAPSGAPQDLAVRVSRPAPVRPGGAQGGPAPVPRSPAPGHRAPDARAQAVQRAVAEAGLAGVPVRVVQPKPSRTPAEAAPAAAGAPRTNEGAGGVDIEDLARRLLDPVSRLIRADLRRGRERSGRPHDGRR
ncbi:hypothetical protein OG912_13330 [Streptomyces sp. NBC_00464]|uniref:hypothetical protein n=1 Tax=Streptomyces sp. NBC_00464 TaxID=2975751 RepID=UPI002E18B2E3